MPRNIATTFTGTRSHLSLIGDGEGLGVVVYDTSGAPRAAACSTGFAQGNSTISPDPYQLLVTPNWCTCGKLNSEQLSMQFRQWAQVESLAA